RATECVPAFLHVQEGAHEFLALLFVQPICERGAEQMLQFALFFFGEFDWRRGVDANPGPVLLNPKPPVARASDSFGLTHHSNLTPSLITAALASACVESPWPSVASQSSKSSA